MYPLINLQFFCCKLYIFRPSKVCEDPTSGSLEPEPEREEPESGEEKRKSSGSISSLVKIWELESASSPKDDFSPADERPGSVVKFEKRIWPPIPACETEKPMVPIKPTVKPPAPTTRPPPPKEPSWKPKPVPAAKPMVCNIYAAPNQSLSQSGSQIRSISSLSSSGSRPGPQLKVSHFSFSTKKHNFV